MFNFSEILFIAVLALVLIGPKQLPEVARNLGRIFNELKRSTEAVFTEIKKPQSFKKELLKEVVPEKVATTNNQTKSNDPNS